MVGRNQSDQASEALRESERRLSRAQEIAHVGDWEWELATNAVHWSDELYRIYGFEPREIAPDYGLVLQQMHPDSKDEFLQAIDAALKHDKHFEMDYAFYRKDGSEAILHTIGQVFRDEEGAPVRMVGVVQDITDQKRAETQLRISEEKFRTIFDAANDGILIADTEDRLFIEANQTICRMLGYRKEELFGMGVEDIHPKEDLEAVQKAFSRQMRGEINVAENLPVLRKDGSVFYADISSTPMDMGGRSCMVGIFRDVTERKGAEETLKAQRRRLAESQRIAHIGGWEHNPVTNEIFWSEELFRLFGLDPKQEPDFGLFFSMILPDDQPRLQMAIEGTMKRQVPFNVDYRLRRPDGETRIFRAMAELIPDHLGKLTVLSGTAQDITEQKLAEEALYEKNTMLQTLINAIPDQVFFKDPQGRHLMVNMAMADALQLGREEIVGKRDVDLLPPEVAEKCERSDAEAARQNAPVYSEESFIDGNGEKRFLDIVKAPIRDSDGKYQGLVVVGRDVTERQRVAEQLRHNEMYVRSILDSVDEGFIVIDRDYRILTANRAYCEQVGLPAEQVLGKTCFSLSHKSSRPCHEEGEDCSVNRVFASGAPYTAYHRHEDADGETIYVETKAFPLKDESGKVTRVIETVSDITEKRLLEEERLKVQKLEAIGTLAGGIAHDFNNLLQGVFGYLSLAKLASNQNKEGLSALDEAEKALHLSVKLTNQLLTFSKGGKPHKKSTDLQAVIDNAVRFSLSGSSTDWRIGNGENLWPVEADEGQIAQVVQNVILNAAQAMPESGLVEITTRNIEAPAKGKIEKLKEGRYVEIAIRDKGIGISEDDLGRIFDPYFTTKEKGNGLGLATSYSIIKNHGGLITVDSNPGEGTTFCVYLPASETAYKPKQQVSPVTEPTKSGKIMVMDDDPMICKVAGAMLKCLGHEVEFAASGEEAIIIYRGAMRTDKPFDIAILDLTIRGGLGGEETVRQLADIDPGIKAVVSSGYAENAVVANYRDYGFAASLNKPYTLVGLQDVLQSLLDVEG